MTKKFEATPIEDVDWTGVHAQASRMIEVMEEATANGYETDEYGPALLLGSTIVWEAVEAIFGKGVWNREEGRGMPCYDIGLAKDRSWHEVQPGSWQLRERNHPTDEHYRVLENIGGRATTETRRMVVGGSFFDVRASYCREDELKKKVAAPHNLYPVKERFPDTCGCGALLLEHLSQATEGLPPPPCMWSSCEATSSEYTPGEAHYCGPHVIESKTGVPAAAQEDPSEGQEQIERS